MKLLLNIYFKETTYSYRPTSRSDKMHYRLVVGGELTSLLKRVWSMFLICIIERPKCEYLCDNAGSRSFCLRQQQQKASSSVAGVRPMLVRPRVVRCYRSVTFPTGLFSLRRSAICRKYITLLSSVLLMLVAVELSCNTTMNLVAHAFICSIGYVNLHVHIGTIN